MIPVILEIDLGDSLDITFTWPDTDGTPAVLTGWSLEIFGAHPSLVGEVTATFVDASVGSILIHVNALRDLPVNDKYSFRLSLIPPAGIDYSRAFRQFVLVPR